MAKILLVDDREDNLLSFESILARPDYTLVKATSGRQALKALLADLDFALILMDVNMPTLDGFETASMIYEREKLRHVPIIFITAHHFGEHHIYKGYQSGAVDYIYKPINPGLLQAKVSVFVELYQKTHQLVLQEQKLMTMNKVLTAEVKERKKSEDKVNALNIQLLQTIDKMEMANKDLDRFAFIASHDLQEPLRKIRMFGGRLEAKYSASFDDEAKAYLQRLQQSAARMEVLIRDILTFSKTSFEKMEFLQYDLNKIFEQAMADLDLSIVEKNATVNCENLPDLCIDPNLIRPLFYNLIGNAIKYSKPDIAPVIRVYSDFNDHGQNKYCRIFFQDNGIGFDQKYANQIFEIFTRLHGKSEFEGTGIGLALCKRIVEKHNGFITAISTPGEGSTFIVSLPIDQPSTQAKSVVA
jgi:signal transduction histidine kinase